MSEYITLLVPEDVRSAEASMRSAASDMNRASADMNRASADMNEALLQHQRFLDEWLLRFESVLEKNYKKGG